MMSVLFSWVSISLILCLALVRAAARRLVHSSNDTAVQVGTVSADHEQIRPELTPSPSGRLVAVS
jgi:hypothetical protein